MDEQRLLVGACGLYCGACPAYLASLPDGKHLLEKANLKKGDEESYICKGCHSNHLGCSKCKIRVCVEEKEIAHCGLCLEFPCNRMSAFQSDGVAHHRDVFDNLEDLKTKGSDKWLEEQKQRWRCKCGNVFSWYEKVCSKCNASLSSYSRQ
jgi:hypothetical protein